MPTDKRERQRANREARLEEQKKQERRERLRRSVTRYTVIVAIVLGVLYLISLRGGDDDASSTTLAEDSTDTTADQTAFGPTDYAGFRAQDTACGGTQPDELTEMTFDAPEDQDLSGTVVAVLSTSCGDLTVELDADSYPETVNSFVFLAREGYFDGGACHRLVDGFVLQCGDPTATGTGDAGYSIPDEFPDEDFAYTQGVVAMANAGAGTTGSQFFIVTGDASQLGPQFSVLGTVIEFGDILDALAEVPLGLQPNGEPSSPLETIYIESVIVQG
jgi:cyclophilin family peptidyl-prolyl cis-trans isomerase